MYKDLRIFLTTNYKNITNIYTISNMDGCPYNFYYMYNCILTQLNANMHAGTCRKHVNHVESNLYRSNKQDSKNNFTY